MTTLAGAGLAGCGSTAPSAPPVASVAVSVPVNGAVLSVAHVTLMGTVPAAVSRIRVAGRLVRVHDGGFRAAVRLHRGRNRIGILAAAPGFVTTRSWVVVRYRARRHRPAPPLADRVNSVCDSFKNRGAALGWSLTPANEQATFGKLADLIDAQVAQLRRLAAPAREQAAFATYVSLEAASVAELRALLAATTLPRARAEVNALRVTGRRENNLGYDLGFTRCISVQTLLAKHPPT